MVFSFVESHKSDSECRMVFISRKCFPGGDSACRKYMSERILGNITSCISAVHKQFS